MKITKAVIPIAGKGTRFLPATKSVAKEIIPIINIPMIYYVVKEAVDSGIEQIVFVTSSGKNEVTDFFDRDHELEAFLESKGKTRELEGLRKLASMTDIISVRQKEQLGLGHAILQASSLINDGERFCVLLGDDIILGQPPVTKQLIDVSEEMNQSSVIGVMEVEPEEVCKYGIIQGRAVEGRPDTVLMEKMVEKPKVEEAPSRLATPGRYILTSDIFRYLREIPRGVGGEYQLTDAINNMAMDQSVYAHLYTGDRYDTGQPSGYLDAIVDFSLKNDEYRDMFIEIVKRRFKERGVKL